MINEILERLKSIRDDLFIEESGVIASRLGKVIFDLEGYMLDLEMKINDIREGMNSHD